MLCGYASSKKPPSSHTPSSALAHELSHQSGMYGDGGGSEGGSLGEGGVGGSIFRMPQSLQSCPYSQAFALDPSPPSSHESSSANEQSL